jgi:glutamate carboxypeptidase
MQEERLLSELRGRREEMLQVLATYVNHESPSRDKERLDGLAQQLATRYNAAGAATTTLENPAGGYHVRAVFASTHASTERPALVLCHFDTVWPAGTLAARPFRMQDGRAYGPGIFDMKASLVLVEYAVRALKTLGVRLPRRIVALLTSDEEIGSPASRAIIEDEARRCAYALVMESPLAGGCLKTARKGVGQFTVEIEGRAAHAGIEPEKGLSAVHELAHQILHIQALGNAAAGTTVNVGVVQGGTVSNVVPAHASALVDVRVATRDEARRIEASMRTLKNVIPGVSVQVQGGFNRPPMERTPEIAALFEKAREVGNRIGLDLTEGATGGASDGNLTAALGVPTLDGLGAVGAGAHAESEYIEIDSLADRAALLAGLLCTL